MSAGSCVLVFEVTSASAMKDAAGKCKGCCVAMLTVTIA